MALTRRALLGTVTTPLVVAGCLGGDGGTDSDDPDGEADSTPTDEMEPEPTPTQTAEKNTTPTEASESTATVQVRSHPEYGDILVGPDGMTLYMFDQDTEGEPASTCSGSCADAWPPLTVTDEPTSGENVTAQLATFEREDGETQVMAGGWPLYYFADDSAPGDANGQGAGGVWWLLRSDGTPIRARKTATATSTADDDGSGGY